MWRKICLCLLVSSVYGAPCDSFSVASGIFDLLREKGRTWEFSAEYKFRRKCFEINRHVELRPLVGLMMTVRGAGYVYGGVNFDLLLGRHLVFAPGFAAGYYWKGGGKDLGYPLEFRSGVELGWQFDEGHRLGVHFYHLSNASLGRKNPGEESLVLFYDIPLGKGFPFQSKCNCN